MACALYVQYVFFVEITVLRVIGRCCSENTRNLSKCLFITVEQNVTYPVFVDLLVYKFVPWYNCTVIARDDAAAVAVSCCTLECVRIVRPYLHICFLSKYGNTDQTLEAVGRLQYLIRCVLEVEIFYRIYLVLEAKFSNARNC